MYYSLKCLIFLKISLKCWGHHKLMRRHRTLDATCHVFSPQILILTSLSIVWSCTKLFSLNFYNGLIDIYHTILLKYTIKCFFKKLNSQSCNHHLYLILKHLLSLSSSSNHLSTFSQHTIFDFLCLASLN